MSKSSSPIHCEDNIELVKNEETIQKMVNILRKSTPEATKRHLVKGNPFRNGRVTSKSSSPIHCEENIKLVKNEETVHKTVNMLRKITPEATNQCLVEGDLFRNGQDMSKSNSPHLTKWQA